MLAALLNGCALESAPLPPSLHIPTPVSDLTAKRAGDEVTLHWTMPKRATDKTTLTGPQQAEICRLAQPAANTKVPNTSEAACEPSGTLMLMPGVAARCADPLPASLDTGAPRLLIYAVRLYGPDRRTAGYSNRVIVVAGTAPPAVEGVTAQVRPDGVLLKWQPQAPEPGMVMQIVRTLVMPEGAAKANPQKTVSMLGAGPVQRQVLQVSLAQQDAGQALDKNATLDHTYTYVLQRIIKLKMNGAAASLAGAKSPAVLVDAKNVFPPSVPQGLAAVADAQSGTIDLSWEPSPQTDTAGYIVYRRTNGGAWQRISPGKSLVTAPAWNDSTAKPGVSYEYAVSAVDRDGNQSARSTSVEEELPSQP